MSLPPSRISRGTTFDILELSIIGPPPDQEIVISLSAAYTLPYCHGMDKTY